MDELEGRVIGKLRQRLIPFLMLCYFVNFLDRVNIGFASLTMMKDLQLSQTAYGLGAGLFFLTYFAFEVPSNLALNCFGARRWIARIMFSWGIISGAMALISGPTGFYVVRLLLGAAEAGFFPGIIFYLTLWFPALYRARMVGLFMAAIPISIVIGAPVSGFILGLDGVFGLRGWQWLFVLEAAPAVLLSVIVLFYLTDRPEAATWLADDQRAWLVARLAAERETREAAKRYSVTQALTDGKVLALAAVYFCSVASGYAIQFFLPQIVKSFGLSNVQTGFVTAIPYAVGLVAMITWGLRSDRRAERRGHAAVAYGIAAIGIAGGAVLDDPVLKMLAFSVALFGQNASLPVFWTLPTAFLSGAAAAGGIAIINALGNLAGFAGPFAMGALRDLTGNYLWGLLLVALLAIVGVIILLLLRHDPTLERAPAARPAHP